MKSYGFKGGVHPLDGKEQVKVEFYAFE